MIEQMVKTYTCTTCGFTSTDKYAVAACQSVRKPEMKYKPGDTIKHLVETGNGNGYETKTAHVAFVRIEHRTHNVVYECYEKTFDLPEKDILTEENIPSDKNCYILS